MLLMTGLVADFNFAGTTHIPIAISLSLLIFEYVRLCVLVDTADHRAAGVPQRPSVAHSSPLLPVSVYIIPCVILLLLTQPALLG